MMVDGQGPARSLRGVNEELLSDLWKIAGDPDLSVDQKSHQSLPLGVFGLFF